MGHSNYNTYHPQENQPNHQVTLQSEPKSSLHPVIDSLRNFWTQISEMLQCCLPIFSTGQDRQGVHEQRHLQL